MAPAGCRLTHYPEPISPDKAESAGHHSQRLRVISQVDGVASISIPRLYCFPLRIRVRDTFIVRTFSSGI